jgi:hypothetical protein
MFFKKRIKSLINFYQKIKNPRDRNDFLLSKLTFKNFLIFGILTNIGTTLIFLPFYNETYINLSISRLISRFSGKIGNTQIPSILREHIYNFYSYFYGVIKSEIKEKELKNFKSIKDFFIREIDVKK